MIFNNELSLALINQRLFPLQLIESIYNIVIFIIIFYIFKKTNNTYKIIGNTLIAFGIGKFIFTFFRGNKDEIMLLGISITQYISALIIMLGIFIIVKCFSSTSTAKYQKKS